MKTTKDHFEKFTRAVKFYQNLLGLNDWRIVTTHRKITEMDNANAMYFLSFDDRAADLVLNTTHDAGDDIERALWRTACHEVCEILLAPLADLAFRDAAPHTVRELKHAIVRTLENVLPGKPKEIK